MTTQTIEQMTKKVLEGKEITRSEAEQILNINETETELLKTLYDGANIIRKHFQGDSFDLCSIMNVKSGKCSEDCRFCAQSAHFSTPVEAFSLVNEDAILERAKEMESEGVHRFSLVSSGKGIDNADFDKLIKVYERISKETNLKICASHGIIDGQKAERLKAAGVVRYHHNLETSRDFYENICTTHEFDDRIKTIEVCQKAGMEVCSGGIIGMGEDLKDRLDMAFELRALEINSIPVNILNPIPGTPMEEQTPLSENEILKTIAVFRFVNPKIHIRYAGGRNMLGEAFIKGYHAGVNGALTGNLLTTTGKNIKEDKEIVVANGFTVDKN